ncbi:hypothetical protein Aph01nite_08210 [Acrocarpospora phusangensis]|uniref:Uncharacterized protein n=1 Tax=Acrocarpospora phusangensis TaxID=1070424 RepID=A0A919Q5G5_9ACTN|nr:hypothetical protein [Acrocarpospora phusangensis]GIH22511.1 hypothetical protein Aph01nite_08210 [Acrocarpospora phusangensis]
MARLRITSQGRKIVGAWNVRATPEDRELVGRLLDAIEDETAKNAETGFYYEQHPANPAITVFQPRKGLFVLVRAATDNRIRSDQFDVVSIAEAENDQVE